MVPTMRFTKTAGFALCAAFLVTLSLAPAASATDGVVLINQATATSGLPGCASSGFPIVICHPGSYRLAGNLTVTAAATDAIQINAASVVLDLNGFTISGPGENSNASDPNFAVGAAVYSAYPFVTVENGTVTGFQWGVQLPGGGVTVRAITAGFNVVGISVHAGVVKDSTADSNHNVGITVNLDGDVDHCRASSNPVNIIINAGLVTGSEIIFGQDAGMVTGQSISGSTLTAGASEFGAPVQATNNEIGPNGIGVHSFTALGYGSNTFIGNGGGNVVVSAGSATSMGNNVCGTGVC